MSPNVDERLASIVRALSEVILPHLPPEASLAQEQVHLCIGHLQILRQQLDQVPGFEEEECADAIALAKKLGSAVMGGAVTTAAVENLSGAADAAAEQDVRSGRKAVLEAVDAVVKAAAVDGNAAARSSLSEIILQHEADRTLKDRRWFAPFGFDTL